MARKIQPEDVILIIGVVPLLAAFILGVFTFPEFFSVLVVILLVWSLCKC